MKHVILYSMEGCPHCDNAKQMLKDNGIEYRDRDIEVYSKEYDKFVEATDNDYVPAFMLLNFEDDNVKDIRLMAPDRDFDDVEEAVEKIKKFL